MLAQQWAGARPFPGSQGGRPRWPGLTDHLSALADVLRFDNTYSLMFPKKISYTVEVLLPDKASEKILQERAAAPAQ